MILPFFKTDIQELSLLQTRWASLLESLLKRPQNQTNILENVSLSVGVNLVPHKLNQKLQGWSLTRMRDNFSQIYDTQDTNPDPAIYLRLVSSAAVVVDLEVF